MEKQRIKITILRSSLVLSFFNPRPEKMQLDPHHAPKISHLLLMNESLFSHSTLTPQVLLWLA